MQRRCCARRRTEGFVLLYTLWLLLGGMVLLAVVAGAAMNRARDVTGEAHRLQSMAEAESAVHETLFELIAGGRPALEAMGRHERLVAAGSLRVRVTASDGLVDLNAADQAVLRRVFGATLGSDGAPLAEAIRRGGRIRQYDQLLRFDGMTPERLTCLLPYVTLASTRTAPRFDLAPDPLRAAIRLGLQEADGKSTAVGTPATLAGEVVRIEAATWQEGRPGRRLVVEALLTGRLDRPIHVLDWRWLSASTSLPCARLR